MQVDYEKYPDVPPGCQLNYSKKTGNYQVFREHRVYSEEKQRNVTVRESVGSLIRGVFKPSELHQLRQLVVEKDKRIEEQGKRIAELEKLADNSVETKRELAQTVETEKELAQAVGGEIRRMADEAQLDERNQQRCTIGLPPLLLGALMVSLTGNTDCHSVCDYINRSLEILKKYLPEQPINLISHDTVRRTLMLMKIDRFEQFYKAMITPLVTCVQRRVIAADGQAGRATGKTSPGRAEKHGWYMTMNFYDTNSRVCIGQRIINTKTNEIPVGTEMIEDLNVSGSIITADAINCQVGFVEAALRAGADYCLALKGNQDKSWEEIRYLFNSTHADQIHTFDTDWEMDHGRVERRVVSIIRGSLLSKPIQQRWAGLTDGSIVQIVKTVTKKRTKTTTSETSYYICSIPALDSTVEQIYEAIRAHWSIENNLHWSLDCCFKQDRIQAGNATYIANRFALNKLALAMLERYRYWLWDIGREKEVLSINIVQQRCSDPATAIECIACSLCQSQLEGRS